MYFDMNLKAYFMLKVPLQIIAIKIRHLVSNTRYKQTR